MINGDVNEFVNHMYYGDELTFLYKNKKLFFQGLTDDKFRYLELVQWEPKPKQMKIFLYGNQNVIYLNHTQSKNFLKQKFSMAKVFGK